MSFTKSALDEIEVKYSVATSVSLKVGVVKWCECGELLDNYGDMHEAFKIGSAMMAKGKFGELFKSQKELTDAIQNVVNDSLESCSSCSSFGD